MPRIVPVDWKTLLKIFEMHGCVRKRKEGSHYVLTCPGAGMSLCLESPLLGGVPAQEGPLKELSQ